MKDPDVHEVPVPLDIMLATYNNKLNSTSVDDEEKINEKDCEYPDDDVDWT